MEWTKFGLKLSLFVLILPITSSWTPILPLTQIYYYCDLQDHDCGIVNQSNMGTYFHYGLHNVGGRNKKMFFIDIKNSLTVGARLITPFFHTFNNASACLSLEYFLKGEGSEELKVIQQDSTDTTIWSTSDINLDWQKTEIEIRLTSEPRFFIEANFLPKRNGIVAIGSLLFTYGVC